MFWGSKETPSSREKKKYFDRIWGGAKSGAYIFRALGGIPLGVGGL